MEFLGGLIAEYLLGQSDDVMPRTPLGWTRVGLLAGLLPQAYLEVIPGCAVALPTI
jgi:hypothetical protein